MRLTTKILLRVAAGSIVPFVVPGGVIFYRQTRIVTDLAFAHAESQANIFASILTVEPPLLSAPLYRQPEALQAFVESLHGDQGLDRFGLGLGLAMVKQIVEQHGGDVNIKSEAGRGTQVTLSLPLQEVERNAPS